MVLDLHDPNRLSFTAYVWLPDVSVILPKSLGADLNATSNLAFLLWHKTQASVWFGSGLAQLWRRGMSMRFRFFQRSVQTEQATSALDTRIHKRKRGTPPPIIASAAAAWRVSFVPRRTRDDLACEATRRR